LQASARSERRGKFGADFVEDEGNPLFSSYFRFFVISMMGANDSLIFLCSADWVEQVRKEKAKKIIDARIAATAVNASFGGDVFVGDKALRARIEAAAFQLNRYMSVVAEIAAFGDSVLAQSSELHCAYFPLLPAMLRLLLIPTVKDYVFLCLIRICETLDSSTAFLARYCY